MGFIHGVLSAMVAWHVACGCDIWEVQYSRLTTVQACVTTGS
jgi:hypothetical protein